MRIDGNDNSIYAIDLGLASEFLPYKALSAAHRTQFNILNTINFASLNRHRGISTRI